MLEAGDGQRAAEILMRPERREVNIYVEESVTEKSVKDRCLRM